MAATPDRGRKRPASPILEGPGGFGAIFEDVGAVQKLINGDWKGALQSARKSDDHVRNALSSAWHSGIIGGVTGVAIKAAPAVHRAFGVANSQTVTDAYAMQYFQSRGMSKAEAAGLTSQIHSESNGKVNAVGDKGAAYGLLQWHADRQANFQKMFGHDIKQSTADEQLAFIVHELKQGTERAAGNKLAGATSAYQAGADASRLYVRPADREGEAARRGSYAQVAGPLL